MHFFREHYVQIIVAAIFVAIINTLLDIRDDFKTYNNGNVLKKYKVTVGRVYFYLVLSIIPFMSLGMLFLGSCYLIYRILPLAIPVRFLQSVQNFMTRPVVEWFKKK